MFAPAGGAAPKTPSGTTDTMGERDDEDSQDEDSDDRKTDLSESSIVLSDDGDF